MAIKAKEERNILIFKIDLNNFLMLERKVFFFNRRNMEGKSKKENMQSFLFYFIFSAINNKCSKCITLPL